MAESESRRQALWYQRPENLPRLMELWETCTDRGERIPALLREAERLQDENAALREIAKVVTQGMWYERTQEATNGFVFCLGCGVELWPLGATHREECVVTKARKLLGTES